MQFVIASIPDDLPNLEKVAISAFAATDDSSLDEWFSFSEMADMIARKRGLCVKAINDDDTITGMIYAQQENPINGKEGLEKWVIVIAAVGSNHTGKGIGSGLLATMEKEAKSRGATKMFVYTNKEDEEVISFYKKNNYEDAGWIRNYQYGEDNSAVFLLKYL